MKPSEYFTPYRGAAGEPMEWLVAVVLLAALILGILLFRERPRHDPQVHSPPLAWLRGGLYFCAILLLSWLSGVLPAIVGQPLVPAASLRDPAWLAMTLLCAGLLVWGYVIWWPRGTLTHGRRLYPVAAASWGLLWGACSGLLLLSVYAVLEIYALPALLTALLSLVLIAVYNINYQTGWWDIHVSPPHNVRAWNNRKVLGAHNPFLIATLAHLLLFGNAGLFVLFYAGAMTAAAVAMRFPSFRAPDGPRVSRETALGE